MAQTLSKEQIIQAIEGMTILELSDLVKDLEEKFGVKAQAFASAPQMIAPQQGVTDEAKESQTVFNVILTGFGDKKIPVIKVVREITKLGLKEAKDLVESVPKPVIQGIGKEEAESIKKKIEEAGGTVEIK